MERAIVTVKRAGDFDEYDLDLPVNVPVGDLVPLIARALGWERSSGPAANYYQVSTYPQNRRLRLEETLAEANIWDGGWLFFQPGPPHEGARPAVRALPGWEARNIPAVLKRASKDQSEELPPMEPGGYQWKPVEDEEE